MLLHQYKAGILSAFQKPLEDKVLNTLFNQKVLHVDQAFRLGHGGYIFLTDRVAEGVVGIQEAPFSSTTAEIMAIFMALSVIAQGYKMEIRADLEAAINAIKALQRRDPKKPWHKSPLAHLLKWGSLWFEDHWDNIKLTWVKGHSGVAGNKAADKLAGAAHDITDQVWSLQIGPPPTVMWWTCWRQQPAPGKPGALIKCIEREHMVTRLTQQVQAALPQTGATVGPEEINKVLMALSWFTDGKERYEAKGSFQCTSERDTLECSLGIKILLGNLPTMVQEMAWYPLAYPEAEMRHCLQGHTGPANEIPMETQAHFMQCEAGE
ncbi:hypothetical protein LPJ64_006361, partial [Coemansia asiatica]